MDGIGLGSIIKASLEVLYAVLSLLLGWKSIFTFGIFARYLSNCVDSVLLMTGVHTGIMCAIVHLCSTLSVRVAECAYKEGLRCDQGHDQEDLEPIGNEGIP